MITSSKVKIDFEFVDPCLCNAWVATAVIGAGVLGAGAQIYGANKAADAQTSAANANIANSRAMYDLTRGDLAPYRQIGTDANAQLQTKLSDLTAPISVNPDDFQNSDYFKFLQTQGQKAVTNSAAMRGLGTSGAALKGALAFDKGLNSQEWMNNFNMQNTNKTNAYNRLKGLIDTGENAAAQTGTVGQSAVNQQNAANAGGANAQAAADNKTGSALSGLANNISGYAMAKGLYGSSGSSGGSDVAQLPQSSWTFG